MAEAIPEAIPAAIHCPSCSTRYRLHPGRVSPSIRRAKCFSCGGIFPVGEMVQRLLALPQKSQTGHFQIEDLALTHRSLHAPQEPPLPALVLEDLDGVNAEILEKTLIETPEFLPESKATPFQEWPAPEPAAPERPVPASASPAPATASSLAPSLTDTTLSGYTSARDAIDKLFAGAPPRTNPSQEADGMDMEATLSVLESTLGGAESKSLPTGKSTLGDSSTTTGRPESPTPWEDPARPASSTLRLSQQDILAALKAAPSPNPTPAEPTSAQRSMDRTIPPDERTEVIPQPPAPPPPPPPAFPPASEAQESNVEVLRLKIGTEIYPGLTMPQLVAWVGEGRILENHLVARQHSDNWLEAHKVPGLRPAFDRLRRDRSGSIPNPASQADDGSPKKTLFGGLFGSN